MNELHISHSGPTLFILIDKIKNVHNKLYYNNFMSIDQNWVQNESTSPKWSTWPLNCFTSKPFVMGSATIDSVLICSMKTSCLLMLSLTLRYLMSMCLLLLPLLLFLEKKTAAELSQKILTGLAIESTIFSPPMKFLNHNACVVAS
jgi:hypothetical protein